MSPRIIRTIFRKDLVDAIRDGRVALAIVVPIALAVLYGYMFRGEDLNQTPTYDLAYVAQEQTGLIETLRGLGGENVNLDVTQLQSADELRARMSDGDFDLGLIIPAGFDAAVRAGEQPRLETVTPPDVTPGTSYLLAALDPALRTMAGQMPPAQIAVSVSETAEEESVMERLGFANFFVLFSLVFLVAMIAMLAIPVILAEEVEKKTFDALVMIASYWDVIIGKALVGIVYAAVSILLTVTIVQLEPGNMLWFVLGLGLLTICLMGFGLWIGGLFKNANQLNTWSGVILIPVILPASAIIIPGPDWLDWLLKLIPTSQAARLTANGIAGETLFSGQALSIAVLVLWSIVGYALLYVQLRRRQA